MSAGLVLVDTSPLKPLAWDPSEARAWWSSLSRLGPAAVSGQGMDAPDGVPGADDWSDAVELARGRGLERILVVEADQFFLDHGLVLDALGNLEGDWDLFTQFEHARLPVGVGGRVFNLASERVARWSGGWRDLLAAARHPGNGFKVRYDAVFHADQGEARLDSRLAPGREDLFRRYAAQGLAGLAGFLEAIEKDGPDAFMPDARPPGQGCMDERLLPAAYGFESAHCAAFPSYVMFDVTNVCNSRCIHCPHSTVFSGQKRRPRHLAMEHLTKVVDQCAGRRLDFVRFTADGEPLLHPQLADMLAYATGRGVGPVGLTTNGMLMDDERARAVLDSGLFMVDFSLDAATAETYAAIRRGLDFDTVVRNVERFMELRDRRNPDCKVMVSFVEQEANRREAAAFKARWRQVADKVLMRSLISNVNLVDTGADVSQTDRYPCPHPFRRLVVTYDGLYKFCPVDWESRTRVGSVDEEDVEAVWHGPEYARARLEHLNLCFAPGRACKDCTDWRGTPWSMGYEKVVHALH